MPYQSREIGLDLSLKRLRKGVPFGTVCLGLQRRLTEFDLRPAGQVGLAAVPGADELAPADRAGVEEGRRRTMGIEGVQNLIREGLGRDVLPRAIAHQRRE